MRKAYLVLFLLVIITLSLNAVVAEQVEYLSFEGFTITSDTTATWATLTYDDYGEWKLVKSIVVSETNKKYLSGVKFRVYADSDGENAPDYVDWKVEVVGDTTQSKTEQLWGITDGEYGTFDELFNVYGDTFTINIYAKNPSPYDDTTIDVEVIFIYAYTINDANGGIKTNYLNRQYIPPGAENTAQGFILNQTEIHLNQSHTLSEGSVSFYLKWDGSTSITISDNIGIDANGYIYIKNDDGTTYTLEGVTPPTGIYVPVYFGWRNGEGYIMLNNTILNLNWAGDVTFTKVGDVSQSSGTLVDEFRLYDNYITPTQFQQGEDTTSMTITFPDGTSTIKIQSDDESPLTTVQVSLFDANKTLLANDTYNNVGDVLSFNVGVNGTYAVFTTPSGSTTVYIMPNETMTVVVPGQSSYVQATIEPATYPSEEQKQWVWLIIKDSQDRVVYRNKWDLTATPVILRVGGSYLISVATEDFSKTQGVYFGLASNTIKINLPKVSELTLYDNLTLFYNYDTQASTLRIYYYDPNTITRNVSMTFYNIRGNTTLYVNFGDVSLVNFKTTELPYKFVFKFTRGNETYNWTQVIGHFEEGRSIQEIGSKELMGLALTIGMLFAFGALSAEWAPIITLIFGTALSIAGLISFPATLASFMGAMGFMAFSSNLNLSASSIKSLTTVLVLTSFAISVGVGVANYYGYVGWGTGGYVGNNYIDTAGQQVKFWQEYTPTYSEYGVPLPTDAKQGIMPFIKSILFGFPQLLMSLGAPPVFALAFQALIYAGMSSMVLYLFHGKEV